jgi:hypothetical protein
MYAVIITSQLSSDIGMGRMFPIGMKITTPEVCFLLERIIITQQVSFSICADHQFDILRNISVI